MIPRIRAEVREEVIQLRLARLTFVEIARQTRLAPATVRRICENHFGNLVERAKDALKREIHLARSERHSSPPFHPPEWS